MTWDEFAQPGRTWRVRARLADRPGTLARLATRLGQHGCNLLGVAVLPVADGPDAFEDAGDVVDELVLRAPATLGHGELMRLVEAQGARCLGVVSASVGDLVDAQTAVLRAATDALSGKSTTYEALRVVLNADSVRQPAKATESAAGEVGAVRLQVGGHRATITLAGGEQVVASRGWAPFTEGELARVPALIAVLGAAGHRPDLPAAVSSTSSVGVVVRAARPADTAAVTQMHRALMAATVLELRSGGSNRLPRGWAERLVTLPRGRTLVAVAGREIVGFAQLIPYTDETAAVQLSLHVEPEWRCFGVGMALLSVASQLGRASGAEKLIALSPPDQEALQHTAASAGLHTAARTEFGLPKVTVTGVPRPCPPAEPRSISRAGGAVSVGCR